MLELVSKEDINLFQLFIIEYGIKEMLLPDSQNDQTIG